MRAEADLVTLATSEYKKWLVLMVAVRGYKAGKWAENDIVMGSKFREVVA